MFFFFFGFVCSLDADKPRHGEPVFVRTGIPAGDSRRALFPHMERDKTYILVVQDGIGTRYSLAEGDNTYIARRSGRRGRRPVDSASEHGHMDLSPWGLANKVVFFHYAVSGLRVVAPGSGSAKELADEIRFVVFCNKTLTEKFSFC